MPPNNTENTLIGDEIEQISELNFLQEAGFVSSTSPLKKTEDKNEKIHSNRQPIIWTNVILITLFHILAVYMFFSYLWYLKYLTIVWGKYLNINSLNL